MLAARLIPSPQEKAYYDSLAPMAGADLTGAIPGKTGAQFLSASGLSRDVLHKIWSIADAQQQGRLDREGFYVACRLVAHAQSGIQPDVALLTREPTLLPMFEGIKKQPVAPMQRADDVISLSDYGNEANNNFIEPSRASNIVSSMARLGLDPLEFIPFQSGPDIGSTKGTPVDWTITEVNRQKYKGLYAKLTKDNLGRLDGKTARSVLERSGLNRQVLGIIWELADMDSDGHLDEKEFIIAMHLATKVKKGANVPSSLPDDLVNQVLSLETKLPSFGNNDIPKPTGEEWKYSRTYLDSAVNEEREFRMTMNGQADETEEEMRYVFDMCAEVESDIRRMKIESDKRKTLLAELDRTKRELQERKSTVSETRKNVNIDRISLNRDRAKLESEILHLKKVLSENTRDVEILRQTVKETEHEVEKTLTQTRTLELQRHEAVRQHGEEMDKIEAEQRETSHLVESWNRLGREDEIRLESERLRNEKSRIIAEMQRNPLSDSHITSTSAFADNSNKWATSILRPEAIKKPTGQVGFGKSFFNSNQ
jgi:epidermal growth factor receptor substrate 15